MKKVQNAPSDTAPRAGPRPFFARLLETQELERVSGGLRVPPMQTLKYPSDGDDCFPTRKYPSDSDTVDVTLRYPSDSDEGDTH